MADRVQSFRVRGHVLRYEGKAVLAHPCCVLTATMHGVRNSYDRHGHGVCSCGAMSAHEITTADRQRWHRQHKEEVRGG